MCGIGVWRGLGEGKRNSAFVIYGAFSRITAKSEGFCGAKGAGEPWMGTISSESSPWSLHFGHGVQGLLYKL